MFFKSILALTLLICLVRAQDPTLVSMNYAAANATANASGKCTPVKLTVRVTPSTTALTPTSISIAGTNFPVTAPTVTGPTDVASSNDKTYEFTFTDAFSTTSTTNPKDIKVFFTGGANPSDITGTITQPAFACIAATTAPPVTTPVATTPAPTNSASTLTSIGALMSVALTVLFYAF
ncbi:hypothetical protein DLAC_05643 [Tieghemostelium lacteum]|uniref:Uncharacterized protein n=1 Tax=Tieghemostelium lacteum TaxID=361077 RepID=A0A151ZGP3_TIELA|nr:hypothetical protein DLAC_05643 [Tieghemostelium lacteum]|eukprot:KYQ93034.1 hypothetical protein DLAC_05643 [Tieghemostelium lacteum]